MEGSELRVGRMGQESEACLLKESHWVTHAGSQGAFGWLLVFRSCGN